MKFRTTYIWLGLIIGLGIILRLLALYFSTSFIFDELVTWSVAKKGILDSWQYLKFENNPPLHYWLIYVWSAWFGDGEKIVRLSSTVISILNISLIYILGKKLFNKTTGLIAAFFMSLSGYQIHYAAEARMYSLVLFWTILSMIFFWQWQQEKNNRSKWFYVLTILAGLYTHITFAFVFLAENLFYFFSYFVYQKKPRELRDWLKVNTLALLLFLPWFVNFAYYSLSRVSGEAWYLNSQVELPFSALNLVAIYVTGGVYDKLSTPFMVLLASGLFLAALGCIHKKKEGGLKLYFAFDTSTNIIFPLIILLLPLFWVGLTQIMVAKYYIGVSVPLYLLLAHGFTKIFKNQKQRAIGIIILLAVFAPLNISIIKTYRGTDWQSLSAYLETIEKPGDQIIATSFIALPMLQKYYHGSSEMISPRPGEDNGDDLLLAIKYNWYPAVKIKDLEVMTKKITGEGRLLVVHMKGSSSYLKSMMVLNWLDENGWRETDNKQFQGFIEPLVYIYEKE